MEYLKLFFNICLANPTPLTKKKTFKGALEGFYHFPVIVMPQNSDLDQTILEDVSKNCPHQFLALHQCMSLPDPDPLQCAQPRVNLAACIKSTVPSMKKIEGSCASKLDAHEQCLKANNKDSRKCESSLKDLRECASGVL